MSLTSWLHSHYSFSAPAVPSPRSRHRHRRPHGETRDDTTRTGWTPTACDMRATSLTTLTRSKSRRAVPRTDVLDIAPESTAMACTRNAVFIEGRKLRQMTLCRPGHHSDRDRTING